MGSYSRPSIDTHRTSTATILLSRLLATRRTVPFYELNNTFWRQAARFRPSKLSSQTIVAHEYSQPIVPVLHGTDCAEAKIFNTSLSEFGYMITSDNANIGTQTTKLASEFINDIVDLFPISYIPDYERT
jgi:hypothetical protein